MTAGAIGDPPPSIVDRAKYRVRQFRRAVWASVHPLGHADEAEACSMLPGPAWALFLSMPQVDRRHGLEVLRTLRARGHGELALAQAALLHDCAKHRGGIMLGHRVAVVLLKAFRPNTLAAWAATPEPGPGGWRQPFWAHAHHPEAGAQLAETAGCDPLAVSLIRRHQEPSRLSESGAAEDQFLAALQAADDDN